MQTILGKDKANLFFLALDNLMDYPYQTNWYRRTLRSHQSHLYLSRMFDVLNEFLIYRNTQLTPLEKLKYLVNLSMKIIYHYKIIFIYKVLVFMF